MTTLQLKDCQMFGGCPCRKLRQPAFNDNGRLMLGKRSRLHIEIISGYFKPDFDSVLDSTEIILPVIDTYLNVSLQNEV